MTQNGQPTATAAEPKPTHQIITVTKPIRVHPAAPEPLMILRGEQLRVIDETRDRLLRMLYEAEEVAKREGFPAGVVHAIRQDRRNNMEAFESMAAQHEAAGRLDHAQALREAARLIKPVGDK